MRFDLLVAALALAGPTGAAAQAPFEGVITITRTGHSEITVRLKGDRVRVETDFGQGPMVVIGSADGQVTTVMMAARRYMVLPKQSSVDPNPKFTATGKHASIAGLDCQYYRQTEETRFWGPPGEVCITTALGFHAVGGGGGLMKAADAAALKAQFGTGFFILKKIDPTGRTSFEVTKIERTAVSDAMFAPPPGFTEMKMSGRPGA
jgi:hypothetical protein